MRTLPVQRLVPVVLLSVLVVALIAIAAGRLGGGSDTNVNQVIQSAFSADASESGRFEATVKASVDGGSGSDAQAGSFEVSAAGVYDRPRRGRAPELDMDMSVEATGSLMRFGVVSTGEKGFLKLDGRSYQLPAAQFEQAFSSRSGGAENATFAALGIDPRSWVENVHDVGNATIGGVATDHVSATVNTDKLVDDLFEVASRSGGGAGVPQVSESDRAEAKGAVESATLDLYAAKSDGSLRKLSAQLQLSSPQASGRLSFDMELSDVGKAQKIEAPAGARPLSELRSGDAQALFGGLAGYGSGSATGGSGSSGSSGSDSDRGSDGAAGGGAADGAAGGGSADSGAGSLPEPAQEFLRCVERARTNAQIQACTPLLR